MKKIIVLTGLFMLALGFTAQAQFYVKVGGGYSLPTATSNFNLGDSTFFNLDNTYNIGGMLTDYKGEAQLGNAGGGTNLVLHIGYEFTENVSAELGVFGMLGAKNSISSITRVDLSPLASTAVNTLEIDQWTQQVRLAPAIVIDAGKEKVNPYARLGVLLPVMGQTNTEIRFNLENAVSALGPIGPDSTQTIMLKTNGAFSVGFNSALGAEFRVSDKVLIFGELFLNTLAVKASKTTIEEYTYQVGDKPAVDVLSVLPTYQKETEYVDELTLTSNNFSVNSAASLSLPEQQLRISSQYSSFGLNVGVSIRL